MKFESVKNELKNKFMSWDTDKIFEFETGKYYDLKNERKEKIIP
jgi:hypothetical protein